MMSKSSSKDESNSKELSFNGKKQEWELWEEKFMAQAKRQGYKHILLGKVSIPGLEAILDELDDSDKVKIQAEQDRIW